MNLTDEMILELSALCNALADGVATEAQRERLAQILSESEAARQFYVRFMSLSASLHDYADEMQTDEAAAPVAHVRIVPPAVLFWTLSSLTAAALVVLALWLAHLSRRNSGGDNLATETDKDEFVARLTGAKDCAWSSAEHPQAGEPLRRGQRVELTAGMAEITFDSGARVVLEGPALLNVGSAWDAALHRGTLQATVPTEAIGFRVSHPAVEVVDLGTEFSMVADESGATEVFVTKGAVEAAPRGSTNGAALVLRETESRRFVRGGVTDVRDGAQKFKRLARPAQFQRTAPPANFVHWSFDETGGEGAMAQANSVMARPFNLRFEGAAARADGRWQGALRFDGQLAATASFPGLSRHSAHTIAFWVKVPADAPLSESGAMVAWPFADNAARATRICWNRNPAQGPLGALRVESDRGLVVGTRPLRDGQWHHIAVVFVPPPNRATAPLQVKPYVDGRLESLSARRSAKRRNKVVEQSEPEDLLVLGRSAAKSHSATERFRGALDELFIADRALSPMEIQRLIHENRLDPSQSVSVKGPALADNQATSP